MKTQPKFQAFAGPKPGWSVCGGVSNKWFEFKAGPKASLADPVEVRIYSDIGKNWYDGSGVEAEAFVAELEKLDPQQEIEIRINSRGGSVNDGIVIYNRLAERRQHVVCIVDSLAASIASCIALAGRELRMPKNARLMVHNPYGVVFEGNAKELRKAADSLDKHRDAMIAIYKAKCGKDEEELEEMLEGETWMNAEEAKAAGFCDSVTAETYFAASAADLSIFRHVPAELKAMANNPPKQETQQMNKQQMIARLNELGIDFEDTASEEELKGLLETAEANAKLKAKNGKAKGKPQSSEEASSADEQAKAKAEAAKAPAPDPLIAKLRADMDQIKAQRDQERRGRIEREVQACVDEDRIPGGQKDKWIERAMADETVLSDLKAMEPKPPGAPNSNVMITSEAPRDIAAGILRFRDPLASWIRGNDVSVGTLSQNAIAMAREINRNRKKLDVLLAANTVDTNLKRNVILSDMMRAFKRKLVFLGIFAKRFVNVPLEGTNKVIVPYFELDTTASTDYSNANGYQFTEDTDAASREVTVNKRKYKNMQFSSSEFRRQPYFNPPMSLLLKSEQLALDVWNDVLSVISAATYGAPALTVESGQMDVDDLITVRRVCNNADWPDMGRACVLSSDAEAALLADESLKHFGNSNSEQPLREGATGRLLGFEMFYSPRVPTNGEELSGFACLPDAILVATAPIAPAPGVRQQLLSYDLVTDPDTGITFEYRYWGDAQLDKDREIVECNYGYRYGNASALKRITSGDSQFSSSSSESSSSSANSSSSSSSQS